MPYDGNGTTGHVLQKETPGPPSVNLLREAVNLLEKPNTDNAKRTNFLARAHHALGDDEDHDDAHPGAHLGTNGGTAGTDHIVWTLPHNCTVTMTAHLAQKILGALRHPATTPDTQILEIVQELQGLVRFERDLNGRT